MGCPSTPLVSYSNFSEELHSKALIKKVPVDGTFEITFHCNLKCSHCYCVVDPQKKELSFNEIKHIIDQLVDAGCLWLLISGGEPLLRKDFLDIYTYAKKKGLLINLFTNGTLITPKIADHLQALKPFCVEITLYGRTKETYEKVTGVPGSYERCLNGIRLLMERNIPLKLKMAVTTVNQHELAAVRSYAEALGLEFRFDPVINPKVDGSKDPCKLRISPEEVVALDLGNQKRIVAWEKIIDKFKRERPDHLFTCGGGLSSFLIDPYGELQLCVLYRKPSYKILEGSFKDGWEKFFPELRAQKILEDNKCFRCKEFIVCESCPGWSFLEHDDSEYPVDYLCKIARLRAEALLKKGGSREEKYS